MRWAYNSAPNGNVAQMGWLNTAGNTATSITFNVAVGFGSTQADAIAAASNTLGENLGPQTTMTTRGTPMPAASAPRAAPPTISIISRR